MYTILLYVRLNQSGFNVFQYLMSKDNFRSNKFYILNHKKVNDTDRNT